MATRSTIAIQREDGTVAQVYCHWDGYLEYNGAYLVQYYNTQEKVEELLSHGDISSLGKTIGVAHPFGAQEAKISQEEYDRLYDGMTLYYGRDRGEADTQARVFKDVAEYEKTGDSGMFEEFNYLFIDGRWYYKSYDGLVRDVERTVVLNSLKKAA